MPESKNFEFLKDYEPLLVEYGLRAELYAYADPNTSLAKTRQFGELLGLSIAIHAGMDCTANSYDEVLGLLRRQRIIPTEIFGYFNQIRLYGNAALHNHERNAHSALQCLICAHEAAKWFVVNVLKRTDFPNTPFKPLPKPEDATLALKQEIEFLRNEAASTELAMTATEAEKQQLMKQLEEEASQYQTELIRYESTLRDREDELHELERLSKKRLRQVMSVASSEPLQSFIQRTERAASRMGRRGEDILPLTQLRIPTGRISSCCGAPMVLAQSRDGGFVTQNCPVCNDFFKTKTLKYQQFIELNIFVECPQCRIRTEADMVGKNYGFRCDKCNWTCELASLVPHFADLGAIADD